MLAGRPLGLQAFGYVIDQAGNLMPRFRASSIRRSRTDAFSPSVAVFRSKPARLIAVEGQRPQHDSRWPEMERHLAGAAGRGNILPQAHASRRPRLHEPCHDRIASFRAQFLRAN